MSDQEVRDGLQRLNERVADLEADVRVTKHNVNNMQATFQALASKLERIEERVGMKLDVLTEKVAELKIEQGRSAGFYAGVAAVITACISVVAILTKFLFGGAS